ncbi:hypothetical protein POTOM_033039 [Populus tomentosa]|uniref:Magnesium transporter CorA-like family protein n=1 Tax=Populus tomentosa TaxID=118781 RepID=A0A8X8CH91_POPTO|nr:hypothetical protein POTOM_033039 [Populus tomentosa]
MHVDREEPVANVEAEEMDGDLKEDTPLGDIPLYRHHFLGMVRQKAYIFDGDGNYYNKDWDFAEPKENEFCWYNVELPKINQKLPLFAQSLIDILCPPLKLQDILSLVSNGPFCSYVNGALVFRVNSPGPPTSNYTFRLAARITENSVITVSLGRVPRLGFSPTSKSLLSEIPSVETSGGPPSHNGGDQKEGSEFVIREHVLEFLLTMNHSEEADNPVPESVSNLVVHIIDTHVDHLQDVTTKLEIELDSVELELDKVSCGTDILYDWLIRTFLGRVKRSSKHCQSSLVNVAGKLGAKCCVKIRNGGFALKKQMLDDRRFPNMHLNLQRILQVIAHGEQVFPRVKEKCSSKKWFCSEDINSLEELIGRLRRLKESVGFIANRVTAIQAGLDSWQAEQINKKLYYLSFLSIIFLPLSIITGARNSLWHECGRSSMDRAKEPKGERWFPQCDVSLRGNASSPSSMLPFPSSLHPYSCLATKDGFEKKLPEEESDAAIVVHALFRLDVIPVVEFVFAPEDTCPRGDFSQQVLILFLFLDS